MKNFHNIEKSGFHAGEYVGYSRHGVWRIIGQSGNWRANLRSGQIITNMPFAPVLTRAKLSELSIALDSL